MSATPRLTPAQRRRYVWRRLVERRTLTRHPVSVARQRVGMVLLALLVFLFGLYQINTRDAAIRRRAVEFLLAASGAADVEVGRAQFRLFDGITLYDVRVATPYNEALDSSADDIESREIFSARSVRLVLDPWKLLLGRLEVERVEATEPTIVLVHNVESGLRNWHLLDSPERAAEANATPHRPYIKLRDARAYVVSIDDKERRSRRIELDADVRPHPQATTAYCIEVRRYTVPPERTTVVFDPGEHTVSNTPFVEAEMLRLQLPDDSEFQRFFEALQLKGKVKLSRLIYDTGTEGQRDTAIELRDARCRIPLSMLDSMPWQARAGDQIAGGPGTDAVAVEMTDLRGRLNMRGTQLDVEIHGRIHGAPCTLSGRLENVGESLDQVGIDLRITGDGVSSPTGALAEHLRSDPALPEALRRFFADYDPEGAFDLKIRVTRAPGPHMPIRLNGLMQPRGVTATYGGFSFPVHDLTGDIEFAGDDLRVDLVGRHGSGSVRVAASIDYRTSYPSFDVRVNGLNIPLDVDLYAALSDRYQSIWKRFNPQGMADITVDIHRDGAGQDAGMPQARTDVTARLHDSFVCFAGYPYPLENVFGDIDIADDRIRFHGLTGSRGAATVRIDGEVAFTEADRPQANLRLEARDVPIDQTLADALPPEGRGAIEQFRATGSLDLLGTISTHETRGAFVYDLVASVRDTQIAYRDFPLDIRDVAGEVHIRPDRISVIRAHGRHKHAPITATGDVHRTPEGFVADLTFASSELLLSETLRAALPEPVQRIWSTLNPKGKVAIESAVHLVSEGDVHEERYRTTLTFDDAAFRYDRFPLPLHEVKGRVFIDHRQIEIAELVGRHDDGQVTISGRIDLTGAEPRGVLRITGRNLKADKSFINRLPPALCRLVKSWRFRGCFDIDLDPLRFSADADAGWTFDYQGHMKLLDASATFGVLCEHIDGSLELIGRVSPDQRPAWAANLKLDRATLAGWHFQNLTARIAASDESNVVYIRDAVADAYGGQATGFGQVTLMDDRTEYQGSIVARGLQLSEYVKTLSADQPETGDEPAKGEIDGNLMVRGRTGKGGYFEGAGEMFVRNAQVWKLPLVFAIFQVLNLAPDENVFHDGWLRYAVSPNIITFHKIDLQGKAISLIGGGRMDLRTRQLDVTLLAGSPVRIRLPFVTELLEGASRELMELHVRGTVQEPRITPLPLRSLREALDDLFPEPPQRAPRSSRR